MELEGGRSGSRKRIRAALEAPAGAESPNPDAGMEDQEPPLPGVDGEQGGAGDRIFQPPDSVRFPVPGADGGTAKDHISQLPDGVLGDIISLLPTKEGARTQVLASRWRHLWRSAPLNLDHHCLCNDKHALDAAVSRILSTHPGPGRRFCAPVYHLHGERAATAETWLRSPALDHLYELELCSFEHRLPYPPPTPLPPPTAAFRFSETLCVATIGDCNLHDSTTTHQLHFPKLKKLALERLTISESSLHTMIAGCPVLECLLIKYSSGFCRLRINSNSLRSIGCNAHAHHRELQLRELCIENAPCLERLLQLGSDQPHISVISAPKLETLGCLFGSNFLPTTLVFGSTIIQGLRVDVLTTSVRTVKILAVAMRTLSLNVIINLMRCFPCLEKLYIESCGPGEINLWRRRHRDVIRSLDISLKTISWRYYRGIKSHVDFATFFVLNAKVLELMTLQVYKDDYREEFIAQQCKKLQLDSKASGGARFRFTPDCSHRASYFSVHDLDLADPFERNEPGQFSTLA